MNNPLVYNDLKDLQFSLLQKGFNFNISEYEYLDNSRKHLQKLLDDARHQRKSLSDRIGRYKKSKEDVQDELLLQVSHLKELIVKLEKDLSIIEKDLEFLKLSLPNLPSPNVPYGVNENDNLIIRHWGTPRIFDFEFNHHLDLGHFHEGIFPDLGASLTGSRFTVLYKHIARLHRALVQFMLDYNIKNGYDEVYVPYIVNRTTLEGTGQLPKFEEDLFKLQGDRDYYLIPTAEVPLTNMVRDKKLSSEDLPLKFTAHTPCFRSEAGSYGRDTKGLMRQHQFDKVEIVRIEEPRKSMEAFNEMVSEVEGLLQALELPYRVVQLCTGDLGFSSAITYDIEVWVPSEDKYREISSISNCSDFQARRMNTRYVSKENGGKGYVHTLNGSALAVGRTLLALLENHQTQNGNIYIPEALRPYFNGIEELDLD